MTQPPSSTLILAVPGSQETQELPLQTVKEAFARGEIEPTRWAWCRTRKDWKPLAELLEFESVPVRMAEPTPVAVAQVQPVVVKVQPTVVKAQPVLVKPAPAVVRRNRMPSELKVKEEGGFGFFKFFVVGLALAIGGVIAVNFFTVDQPLRANLLNTSFSATPVHAHLGAFFQPNTIVIHLQPAENVTAKSLADYLINLAKSTPTRPFSDTGFESIGLTSAWTSQCLMSGEDWQALAKMGAATDDAKKDFILTHAGYPSGERLLGSSKSLDPDYLADRREKAWKKLVALLLPN